MAIIAAFVVTIISAITYRLGGLGREDAKRCHIPLWLCHPKYRDLGIPVVCGVWMYLFTPHVAWWRVLIAFLACFGALTTYWDDVFKKDNFFAHGLGIGAAYLLYSLDWTMFVRAGIMSIFMGLWCKYFSNDWVEELGRGGIIGLTLLMLLI